MRLLSTIRAARFTVAMFTVGLLTAGMTTTGMTTTGAATQPAEESCDTVAVSVASTVAGRTLWTYTHTVDYCAEGGKITVVEGPDVEVEIVDPTCVDNGPQDRSPGKAGEETARTFSMGLVTCDPPNADPYQVNPWVILVVHADGDHQADRGIEPR